MKKSLLWPTLVCLVLFAAGCGSSGNGPCTPDCMGKVCGDDDGCGGRCTACPTGQTCNQVNWHCESCTPDCTGKTCGQDDGCGGKCTGCPTGQTCNQSTWQCEGCAPDCTGKTCGQEDGCGNKCLNCPTGKTCNQTTWQCEGCTPDCTGKCGGPDGCGGTCPNTCPSGQTCQAPSYTTCSGSCTPDCTGKCGGPDGCGGTCPNTCPSGQTCQAPAYTTCSGTCTPNCTGKTCGQDDGCGGKCTTCPTGQTCNQGNWQCESTFCPPAGCAIDHSCAGTDMTISGRLPNYLRNQTAPYLEPVKYFFQTDSESTRVTINLEAEIDASGDYSADMDLIVGWEKQPLCADIVRGSSSRGDNCLWSGSLIGRSNETIVIVLRNPDGSLNPIPAGITFYVTVCNFTDWVAGKFTISYALY